MSLTSPDKADTFTNNHVIEAIKIPPTDNTTELVFIWFLIVMRIVPVSAINFNAHRRFDIGKPVIMVCDFSLYF